MYQRNLCLCTRYLVESAEDGPLVSMPLRQFIYSLGSRSPAPGGGSASAAIAAMVSTALHDKQFVAGLRRTRVYHETPGGTHVH